MNMKRGMRPRKARDAGRVGRAFVASGWSRVRVTCVYRGTYATSPPVRTRGDVLCAVAFASLLRVGSFAVEDPDALTDLHLVRCLYCFEPGLQWVPCVRLNEIVEVHCRCLRHCAQP